MNTTKQSVERVLLQKDKIAVFIRLPEVDVDEFRSMIPGKGDMFVVRDTASSIHADGLSSGEAFARIILKRIELGIEFDESD